MDAALYPTSKKQVVADRLLGVAFGVAAQLVQEGVATMEDTDRGATVGLRWANGPFAMMNDLGLQRALALVSALDEKWPGFAPELLKTQAARREPWTLRDVRLTVEGPIAIITMSRPDALNALNSKVMRELKHALAAVRANRHVRVVILTGEGNAFVAGADIKEMQALAEKPAAIRAFTDFGQGVLQDIETLPQPVIAAINGFALGGGLELALACDIRLASSDARLGFPEVSLGIFPGLGGTQRAARLAGLIAEGRGGRGTPDGARPSAAPLAPAAMPSWPEIGPIATLLGRRPAVINIGLELFAESLQTQGVPVVSVDWRPPAGGKTHLLDLLDRLEG